MNPIIICDTEGSRSRSTIWGVVLQSEDISFSRLPDNYDAFRKDVTLSTYHDIFEPISDNSCDNR